MKYTWMLSSPLLGLLITRSLIDFEKMKAIQNQTAAGWFIIFVFVLVTLAIIGIGLTIQKILEDSTY